MIVEKSIGALLDRDQVDNIVDLYIWLKSMSDKFDLEVKNFNEFNCTNKPLINRMDIIKDRIFLLEICLEH